MERMVLMAGFGVFRVDPGTTVKVTGPAKFKGKTYKNWVEVEYNGQTLYAMKEFLK